jgi:hypothetical protein
MKNARSRIIAGEHAENVWPTFDQKVEHVIQDIVIRGDDREAGRAGD